MVNGSTIEWTETTWNPIAGCSKVSPGCTHCYAERMSHRLGAMARNADRRGAEPGRLARYAGVVNAHGRWNGNLALDDDAIGEPLRWKRGRVVFVNSMSDLFHERAPITFIQRVFETMNRCPQHTFQVLTKRPEVAARMAGSLSWSPNIWLGTSVESADYIERIKALLTIPAAVRFLSAEPLLGPMGRMPLAGIDWVIVGGESGPGARPMNPAWVRRIRDRCVGRGVAFFFKQWGGTNKKRAGRSLDGRTWDQMPLTRTLAS